MSADTATRRQPIVVGISGSSGAILACRTVEILGDLEIDIIQHLEC